MDKFLSKKWISFFLIGVVCLLFGGTKANATSIFDVSMIENPQQYGENQGYFNLVEKPGAKGTLQVKVTNPTNEKKEFSVYLTDANTNDQGQLDYSGTLKNSSDLTLPFTKVATNPKPKIVLAKKSSTVISIPFTMPKKEFSGAILGGITVKEENPAVFNTYSYTIAVVLMNQAYDSINQKASLTKEETTYQKKKEAFSLTFPNDTGFISKDNTLKVKIQTLGGKEVYDYTNDDVDVAPHQQFSLTTDALRDRVYRWTCTINQKKKEFYSVRLGEKVHYLQSQKVTIMLGLVVLVVLLFLGGGSYLIWRRKKQTLNKN